MKIRILYEDKDTLVIDKPSGIATHSNGKNKEETIVDWFIKKYPEAKNIGESIFIEEKEIEKPGIVHRLDKETSGVLILAKNQKAHEFFKKQFSAPALELKTKSGLTDRQNRIKKTYLAIVESWPKNNSGIINKPIGRSSADFRKRLAGRGARGELREAITEWKVLKRFEMPVKISENYALRHSHSVLERQDPAGRSEDSFEYNFQKFSLLEISPKTGRTHQIRVHLKYLSYPIVCDLLYNPKGLCPKRLSRLGLHAKSIEFTNLEGKRIKIESEIPPEFKRLLNSEY